MPANTRPVHAPTEVLTLLKGAARAPITPATPMYVPVPLPPPAPSADAPGSALAAMLVCTLDGQVVAVNDPALAMFGADAAEFAARPLDGWLSLRPELADLGATDARRPRDVHLAGRRSNGVPFPVRGHVRLVDAGGEHRAVCTLRELDTHELVGVAQRFFDAGFDGAPIGMALFNSDGRYVRVNAELCRTLGRSEADLVGRRDQELTHPDDRQSDVDAAWAILEGRIDTHQCEKRFVRPDGSVVWTIANLTFLRDDRGRPLLWVGHFQDITARRAAEESRRRERDLSQAILDSMSDGLILTRGGEIVAVNRALCRLTGFDRAELVGARAPYPFWPPERRDETMALRDRIIEQGSAEFELSLMHKDGRRFHASVTAAPLTTGDGFVNTVRDISERKRHETELQRRATHDGLTGLLNRTAFHERLRTEIAHARAAGRALALVLIDIDHFKAVNDRSGHLAGDRVLVDAADRLRAVSRAGDHVARMGGEEFAWLLPATDGDAATWAAERARSTFEGTMLAGRERVTVSLGVCELADAADADELYRLADAALYRAKAAGRNRCVRHVA